MGKATDELLKDHRMVRQVLADFRMDNPRFSHLLQTLQRILVAHAWFEDEIFRPAFKAEKRLARLDREIGDEHQDIDALLHILRATDPKDREELDFHRVQLCAILETHFKKEEDALFPLAERVLGSEGLIEVGAEMHRRRMDVRGHSFGA